MASVSKSRLKMPLVAPKAKFGIDVGVTPSESIKVYHPLAGPPPQSIPLASALELIATPVNPLLDPRPRPSSDPKDQIIKGLKVSSLAQVIEALQEQVTPPACAGLSPDAETSSGNGQFPSPIHFPHIGGQGSALSSHLSLQLVGPSANGGKSAPSPLHLHMHQQPHLGVEMEDNTSGDTSDGNAVPPQKQ
ncbi:hypothetical protein PAXRUDRAFT_18387 [Paxillus rubicundulus Ve08.2h10]|uniref:Uncharacterized protein n=1 Tax=Paxillus rubicundulus Ve08.2h10 TaxID=930991 RepID=A0A0D0CY89_9AGAM|nr:hypothetical protein PAXRUDRAFT_18387 [Paxillus rubicundulus Ve08.2h10]